MSIWSNKYATFSKEKLTAPRLLAKGTEKCINFLLHFCSFFYEAKQHVQDRKQQFRASLLITHTYAL